MREERTAGDPTRKRIPLLGIIGRAGLDRSLWSDGRLVGLRRTIDGGRTVPTKRTRRGSRCNRGVYGAIRPLMLQRGQARRDRWCLWTAPSRCRIGEWSSKAHDCCDVDSSLEVIFPVRCRPLPALELEGILEVSLHPR